MDTYENLDLLLATLQQGLGGLTRQWRAAAAESYPDITGSEIRLIGAIGEGSRQNMSAIAKKLSVTVGTLTISVNSLLKKGYVKRERSEKDHRVVYISLSERGKGVLHLCEGFRRDLLRSVLTTLTPEETEALIKSLEKLNEWVYAYSVNQ